MMPHVWRVSDNRVEGSARNLIRPNCKKVPEDDVVFDQVGALAHVEHTRIVDVDPKDEATCVSPAHPLDLSCGRLHERAAPKAWIEYTPCVVYNSPL
jgi:hypothetical protein